MGEPTTSSVIMSADNVVMECQEYGEAVPEEEVVETSYMCGECFLLFQTTEDFNAHQCQESAVHGVESIVEQNVCQEQVTDSLGAAGSNPCVWEAQESEAAMEEAVANILGEKMKKMAPQRHSAPGVELEHTLSIPDEPSIEHTGIMDQQMESVVEHTVENKDIVEIPSSNIYMFDNPIYLNRLMKDNTFGRRVRHDAPYRQRLGPWDNKSSRLLIKLVKEYPKAYFILDKECKRTEAWETIKNKMSEAGFQFTVLQIRMRWRELVKAYRTNINYNDMHNIRRYCQYFEELNDLFGVWDFTATMILIRQMEFHGSKRLGQNGGTRMRFKVWDQIRLILEEDGGYSFTADQVQGRWSTLVNLYQRMVENNSKPHTEKISMAFQDQMERVFNYVPERNSKWRKIMEKRGKTPRAVKRNWTHPIERKLLMLYRDRIYRFNNEHIKKMDLWKEIVQQLKEETDYSTTVEKARLRFNELVKQFTAVEQHNSQSGTIRRECKHHELLSEIYSVYNYWPHDRSTIKLNKSNALRMRQVNAQLAWSELQSRALLQLYPSILVNHISSGDHQPIEEFWLQLAKAYLNTQGDRKQCYEIEEHIALLRRGYKSRSPFPFCSEMQLLEETEITLGFSPDPVVSESDDLVPYWNHEAAILLLDLIIMYRQDGVKTSSLFEMISRDLENHGYRYTGEECRVYYFLLRQLYSNRLRTLKRNRELLKPFPYMDKMAEVDAVVSLPRYVDTSENSQAVVSAASLIITSAVEGEQEVEIYSNLTSLLSKIRLFLRQKNLLHPVPSVKKVAQILVEAVSSSENVQPDIVKLKSLLEPVSEVLKVASGRVHSTLSPKSEYNNKNIKSAVKKDHQPKYGGIRWTENNLQTMLEVIKEWRLLCFDTLEFETLLSAQSPVWKDVASKLRSLHKICPSKCHEKFTSLCREYKSVVAFNTRHGSEEPVRSVTCQELLQSVLMPLVVHEADFDPRDDWDLCEVNGVWSHYKTSELLFTIKELGSHASLINWETVSQFMNASGHPTTAEKCRSYFESLLDEYEAVECHNRDCTVKNRKKSPFYFKIRSLKMNEEIFNVDADPALECKVDLDVYEEQKTLVHLLKLVKKSSCHSVPRRPLLSKLARLLDCHFSFPSPTFTLHRVWQVMVQLHILHQEAFELNAVVDDDRNLGELWQNHPSPLVAYNLLATPLSNWKLTEEWCYDEIYLLIDGVIHWELQPRSLREPDKNMFEPARQSLQKQGYQKSPEQCFEQWQYLSSAYFRGGYVNFVKQLNNLHLINPYLLQSKPPKLQQSIHTTKCSSNSTEIHKFDAKIKQEQDGSCSKSSLCEAQIFTYDKKTKRPLEDKENTSKNSFENNESASICNISKEHIKRLKVFTKTEMNTSEKVCALESLSSSKSNAAPGSVVSYVHVNVPKQKRSVQVSTEELNHVDEQREKLVNVSINPNSEPDQICVKEIIYQLSNQNMTIELEKDNNCKLVNTSTEEKKNLFHGFKSKKIPNIFEKDSVYYYKCKPDSEDKVMVEVFKVILNEESNIIECRTREVSPRTICIQYPSNCAIPMNMVEMWIPHHLAYPELQTCSRGNLESQTADVSLISRDKKNIKENLDVVELNITENSYSNIQNKMVDENSGVTQTDKVLREFKGKCKLSEITNLMKLFNIYHKRVSQEKLNLVEILQETHAHQTIALKNIFNIFQEVCDLLV